MLYLISTQAPFLSLIRLRCSFGSKLYFEKKKYKIVGKLFFLLMKIQIFMYKIVLFKMLYNTNSQRWKVRYTVPTFYKLEWKNKQHDDSGVKIANDCLARSVNYFATQAKNYSPKKTGRKTFFDIKYNPCNVNKFKHLIYFFLSDKARRQIITWYRNQAMILVCRSMLTSSSSSTCPPSGSILPATPQICII